MRNRPLISIICQKQSKIKLLILIQCLVWFLKSVIFGKIFTSPNSPVVRQALSDRDVDGSNPGKGKKNMI